MRKLILIDISSLLYDDFVSTYDSDDFKIPSTVLHGLSQVYFLDNKMVLMTSPTKKKIVSELITCIGQITPSWERYFEDFAELIIDHSFDKIPSKLKTILDGDCTMKFITSEFDITKNQILKTLYKKFPFLYSEIGDGLYIDNSDKECVQKFVRSLGFINKECETYDSFHSLLYSINGINFNCIPIYSFNDIKK